MLQVTGSATELQVRFSIARYVAGIRFSRDAACAGMAVIAMVTLLSLRSVAQVMSAMQGSVPEMLTLEQAVVRAASNESAFGCCCGGTKGMGA